MIQQQTRIFPSFMCMVVQPHVLTADKQRGLQIGSLVVITETGAEALQNYPMEFVEI